MDYAQLIKCECVAGEERRWQLCSLFQMEEEYRECLEHFFSRYELLDNYLTQDKGQINIACLIVYNRRIRIYEVQMKLP